jgi:hypothetical protein
MPDCGGSTCSCKVEVGNGLTISGSGSLAHPYVISIAGGLDDSLNVEDTPTVDLVLTGGGTPVDPYTLRAIAKVRVQDLVDVLDPEGGPSSGDTIVWVTSGVDEPRFEFRPPPANPAGAVNVGDGLEGVGSLADPIELALLGASAGGSTSGLEVYLDSAGNLRATAPSVSEVDWDSITDKPTAFPATPSTFTGVLTVAKGGTGATSLADITVGNSTRVNGSKVWVQSSSPVGATANDLWFW